jgi:hypothetical protein
MRWAAKTCLLLWLTASAVFAADAGPFGGVNWAAVLHVPPSGKTEEGGRFYVDAVRTGQLTNGLWVAAVPYDGGGTAAIMYYSVFVATENGPKPIGQAVGNKMSAWFEHGYFLTLSGEYKPGDGNCCPSRWRETHYSTNGKNLVVLSTRLLNAAQYERRVAK